MSANKVRLTFPFTRVYKACPILFQVSLGDDFPTENDSLVVLSKAIERVRAALRRASRPRGISGVGAQVVSDWNFGSKDS